MTKKREKNQTDFISPTLKNLTHSATHFLQLNQKWLKKDYLLYVFHVVKENLGVKEHAENLKRGGKNTK